jgi:hypothetical protein
MVVQIKVPPENQTDMATKTSRASIDQKRKVKNQRRAVKAQKRNAAANQCKAKASVNNYSNPKTNEMGQTKSGNAKIEAKDIRVGISFFMNHPKVGHQVIDFATDLERFTITYNHVNQSEVYRYSSKYQFHKMLMDLYVSDAPVDEHFFTIAMHFLVTFDSVGAALKSNKFANYGFMIEPAYDDFEAGMVGTLDYDSWDYGRTTRNAA